MGAEKNIRPQSGRPNYAQIHSKPLPLETYPLPTFIPHNPLSYVQIAYTLISHFLFAPSSHPPGDQTLKAYYDAATRSVHVTDPRATRVLWERGFFGKGSLSRSEPEWLEREKRRLGVAAFGNGSATAGEVTSSRRDERREAKRARARAEAEEIERQLEAEGKSGGDTVSTNGTVIPGLKKLGVESKLSKMTSKTSSETDSMLLSTDIDALEDREHLQLSPVEALFLCYGLGVISIRDPVTSKILDSPSVLDIFRRSASFPTLPADQTPASDDEFIVSYIVYHHFRSLGWVVRSGIKFAVDFLLYNRGPVFSHAEFAILIIPSYSDRRWKSTLEKSEYVKQKQSREWWWLQGANRVQAQVMKSLILVYVAIPPVEAVQEVFESASIRSSEDLGKLFKLYRVREIALKRWVASRNRD